jgi:signal transduction histidine kinase
MGDSTNAATAGTARGRRGWDVPTALANTERDATTERRIRAEGVRSPYRGQDRRARVRSSSLRRRQLVLGVALLLATSVAIVALAQADPRPDGVDLHALTGVLATGCVALATVAGFISCLRWRLVGDASSLRLGAALLVFGALIGTVVLAPFVGVATASDPTIFRLGAAMSLTVAILLAITVIVPPIDTRATARRHALIVSGVVAVSFAATVPISAFEAFGRGYSPPISGLQSGLLHATAIMLWLLLGCIALARGVKRASWLWTWSGLMMLALVAAAIVAACSTGEDLWSTGAYALRLLALLFVLNGVGQELKLAYFYQRSQLFDTRRSVQAHELRRDAERAEREERAHEARSALLGIQAATRTLVESYDDFEGRTRHELRDALEAEIQLLRFLVDADAATASVQVYDLAASIAPIVTCRRTVGQDVVTDVAPGVWATGRPVVLAEVLQTLLENADRHAPGSRVVVRCRRDGDHAVVRVEDRGPGVPPERAESIFVRGTSTAPSGSGLGLYLARQLIRDDGGDVHVEPRPGGGASFVVSVPTASLEWCDVSSAQLLDESGDPGKVVQVDALDPFGGEQCTHAVAADPIGELHDRVGPDAGWGKAVRDDDVEVQLAAATSDVVEPDDLDLEEVELARQEITQKRRYDCDEHPSPAVRRNHVLTPQHGRRRVIAQSDESRFNNSDDVR